MDLREACEVREGNFPPKIRRAILLHLHGFPVTQYLILSTKEIEYVVREVRMAMQRSAHGIVVRAVPEEDGATAMGLPYLWLEEPEEVRSDALKKFGDKYLMAFAPHAKPEETKGVVVGRYAYLLQEERRVVEYYLDEIRPRILDRVEIKDPRFGCLIKEAGRFFRVINMGCASVSMQLIQALERYDETIRLLGEELRAKEICLEFTSHRGKIEFHDFDWRKT